MRTTLTAVSALALLAMATPASATDVYSSAKDPIVGVSAGPANWTGFYLGVNGGYGEGMSSRDSILKSDVDYGDGVTWHGETPVAGAALPSGFLFGGQIGYLYQPQGSNFVIGGEFAFDGSNITGDKAATGAIGTQTLTFPGGSESGPLGPIDTVMHQQLDWVGTLTGVGGLTLGNAMVYAKAGLAFGKVQEDVTIPGGFWYGGTAILSRSSVDTGWTAGAGIAYKITPNWIFGLEWNYYDLGSHPVSFVDDTVSGMPFSYKTTDISEDFWDVRGKISYQVSSVYQPLK